MNMSLLNKLHWEVAYATDRQKTEICLSKIIVVLKDSRRLVQKLILCDEIV